MKMFLGWCITIVRLSIAIFHLMCVGVGSPSGVRTWWEKGIFEWGKLKDGLISPHTRKNKWVDIGADMMATIFDTIEILDTNITKHW